VGVSPARSAVRAGKMPTPRKDDQRFLPRAIRPLRLLAKPEEIRVIVTPSHDLDGRPVSFTTHQGKVHRLEHAVGPERIAGQWWVGHDKTRDYFDVEDSTGKRFWIFRVLQSARWFVQGHFE
jgi:protein ImuB